MYSFCGFVHKLAQVYRDGPRFLVFEPEDEMLYVGQAEGNMVHLKYYLPNVWIDSRASFFEFDQQPDGSFLLATPFGSNLFYPDTIMIVPPMDENTKIALNKIEMHM